MSHALFHGFASRNTQIVASRRLLPGARQTPWPHGPCHSGAVWPGALCPPGALGRIMTGTVLLLAVFLAIGRPVQAETLTVRCNRGETLSAAVAQAAPGDTIRLTGRCKETVVITTDDLTLTSTSGAIIDGQGADQAVLTIDGARRITLQGLTVQHGLRGVHARQGASVSLTGVTATKNTGQGLRIDDNTTARLTDCTAVHNGASGILVRDSSSAHFQGTITSQDNGGNGIGVFGAASVDFLGTTISSQNNGGTGISVVSSSSAFFDGATVTTNKNTYQGINISDASNVYFANTTQVEAKGNQSDGLQLAAASNMTVQAESTFSATDNGGRGLAVLDAANLYVYNSTIEARASFWEGIEVAASSVQVQDSTVSTSGNGANGLAVILGSRLLMSGVSKVHTAENFFSGLLVRTMSSIEITDKSTVISEANLSRGTEAAGLRIAQFSVGTTEPQTKVILRQNGKALDVEPDSIWAPEGKVEVIK